MYLPLPPLPPVFLPFKLEEEPLIAANRSVVVVVFVREARWDRSFSSCSCSCSPSAKFPRGNASSSSSLFSASSSVPLPRFIALTNKSSRRALFMFLLVCAYASFFFLRKHTTRNKWRERWAAKKVHLSDQRKREKREKRERGKREKRGKRGRKVAAVFECMTMLFFFSLFLLLLPFFYDGGKRNAQE